jgi:S1-C subfamily serine protease
MNGENSYCETLCEDEPLVCKPPLCNENLCRIPYCDEYRPEEIMCKFKDAVVSIQSEFILIGSLGPTDVVNNTTPLGKDIRYDYFVQTYGFFVEGKYIIAPSQAVLLPPSLSAVCNRYPFFQPQNLNPGEESVKIQDVIIRATRILVTVYNVNGKGKTFVYEADLVGVDGAGDISVLRIDMEKCWNAKNPCVQKCHPQLEFGSSRSAILGEKVYLLSGPDVNDAPLNSSVAIFPGLLTNQKCVDPNGIFLQELIAFSMPAAINKPGGPILNAQGKVLGMAVGKLNGEYPVGTSEFFMRRIILEIIKGICPPCGNCHLEVIDDPVGAYYRYKKSYLGIGYNVANGLDYDVTKDYGSILVNAGPAAIFSSPRVRLDEAGKLLNSPSCKQQIGVKVVGVAGMNPNGFNDVSFYYVPGGIVNAAEPLPTGLPVSPFIDRILPGDIITHINNVQIGELYEQVAPGLITWNKCPGEHVHICFRRGGNAPNNESNSDVGNYEIWYEETATLLNYPKVLDYPAYAIVSQNINAAFTYNKVEWSFPIVPPPSIGFFGGAIFQPSV